MFLVGFCIPTMLSFSCPIFLFHHNVLCHFFSDPLSPHICGLNHSLILSPLTIHCIILCCPLSSTAPTTIMWRHISRATSATSTSPPLVCNAQTLEPHEFLSFLPKEVDTSLTVWQCTSCGRQYKDPSAPSIFIRPPPLTQCIQIRSSKTTSHANNGFASLPVASGPTCDYIRVHAVSPGFDPCESTAKSDSSNPAAVIPIMSDLSAPTSIGGALKAVGEHGRVSRQIGAVDIAFDQEEDTEECGFWTAKCKDADCIYEGDHCRDRCALAELGEEPKTKLSALKRGLRFRRSAS